MENKPICKIEKDESKRWYLNGQFHREDGPAIEYKNGDTEWFINGIHHREDGPAIDCKDGTKFWIRRNKLHRLDGPAAKHDDGSSYWYIRGVLIDDQIREWAYQQNVNLDNLTEDDELLIKLVWVS